MAGEFSKFSPIKTVLDDAFGELGLTKQMTYVGNDELTASQMVSLLTSAGQDLCTMHDWQMLHRVWNLPIVTGQREYALPADWNSFVNSTAWVGSDPAIGAIGPVAWRALRADGVSSTTTIRYRILGNKMILFNTPAADRTLDVEYYSRGWLLQNDQVTHRDNPDNDDNLVLFDRRIILPLLKLRWREAKQFDTSAATQEFNNAWDLIVGRDAPAPNLSIVGAGSFHLIDEANVPSGDWPG